jgi:hypothetical protein
MDDMKPLQDQFKDMTLEHKKALDDTYWATVSLLTTAESRAAFKAALAKERQIAVRRSEVLSELFNQMGERQ